MRRRQLFWSASLLAIGMSACTTLRPPPPMDTGKACAEWRWIGISRPEARCPDIPGWAVRPLFPQLSPVRLESGEYCKEKDDAKDDEKVPGPELIRELNRFCVYEIAHRWTGHHPFPPVSAELVRLDQDCAALSTAAFARVEEDRAWQPYSERLLAQVGVPQETLTIANPFGVRLAFLDTEPTREEIPRKQGNSPHGYTLAHIARHLVCREESCAARITTQLALPIIDFDARSRKLTEIDTHGGGFLGTQSDLAKAIWSEVDAWREDRRQSSERHLVLNLSLAWDGELFGGLDEQQVDEMEAGTQAVYRALQYAAGFDALVLAAAGNQRGEPCPNFGPLLPAAWERGGQREESCGGPREGSPLLYAVGGVDSGGHPLVNARPGGMPRRVAYAKTAVVACPDSTQHTAMLTGSSVATAVVSSIASVVWAAFPTLTSSEVMAILDASGDELPLPADFWFPASVPTSTGRPKVQVHRLSLCSALKKACEVHGPCVPEPTCDLWTAEPSDPSSSSPPSESRTWRPNSCQPWLYPQPEVDPCPVCPPYKP